MKKTFTLYKQAADKHPMCRMLFSLAAILISIGASAQTFVHPGVPFTRADLAQLKANITTEPWLTGYNALKNDSHSQLSYGQRGPFATVTRAPNLNNSAWIEDMQAIHNLAFMYVFTGDSTYARKATNLLDAWAVTNTNWGGGENMLDIGDMAPYFITGADILRSTFPGWSAANEQHVNNYFRTVLYPTSYVPNPLRDNNKGALQLQIAVGIAAYLSDPVLWQQAIEVYRMDAGGGLRCSLPNGEVGDTGRDDHWFVQIQALGWSAEVAWKQGIDLFSEFNNRLLAISELYARYSQAPTTVSFIPFGGYAAYWTNWGISPGYVHQSPFNNIIKGAYALRKGIATPYTEQIRSLAGEGAWSFLYLKSADTSHATPLTPIIYPADNAVPVSSLTNIDIGNTGIKGNAAYVNNNWTVNGAGKSVADAVNFTFKQIKGDAGIIAKIESNSTTSAITGLMIRESLATTANYVAVSLAGNGPVSTASRGATGQTVYTHYGPVTPWWLKIERVGNRIFTYHSKDGINWSNNALSIVNMPADAYIGFYTISNNISLLNTAVLSHVAVTNTTPVGAPVITSATSATGTVGSSFTFNTVANGNPSKFRATGLPAGLTIDTLSGVISGIPTVAGQSISSLEAINSSGSGTATLIINITGNSAPAAPAGVTAAVVNGSNITIAWQAVPGADTYTIKRSQNAAGPFTVIQSGISLTSYTDAAPVPEINNYYVVTASTGSLESVNSAIVTASVPPATPNAPAAINKNHEIDLSWNSASGAATYNVKRGTLSGGPYTTIANVATTNFADLNVSNGSPYYYVISSMGQTKESPNSAEAFGVPGSSTSTWSAQPESDSLNLAKNWLENTAPVNPAIITFAASSDTVLTNDITNLAASRIQFNANANSYSISGSPIHLRNDLVNNSAAYQTLSMPITLDTLLNISTPGVNGTIALTGQVTGSGSLLKNGIGFLYLNGNNTYSGGTVLNGNGQSWPPVYGVEVSGTSTGAPSAPTSGPLGTGKITMNGGALFSANGDATLYNDIEIAAGKTSYFYQTTNALNLYGRLTGSGTIIQDGNTYAGLHLFADNSSFTGYFVSKLRSGNLRLRFEVPQSGSANAAWNLDANGNDCQGIMFPTGTLNFGALSGRGAIRTDGGGSPTISIGALNITTNYGGTMTGTMNVEKVGTAILSFYGNQAYSGTTTIKNGTFLLDNSPTSGTFTSPVIATGGTFGGTGQSSAPATIGTGSGSGAILAPGDQGIGSLKVSTLTLNADATYYAELSTGSATSDKITAGIVNLTNHPKLKLSAIDSTNLAQGASFTIIDNTGTNPITGTFKDLPELSALTVGNFTLRISYKGGTGNDAVLLDDRTLPITITSALTDTVLIGQPMSYTITAIKSPNHFTANGLPAGLQIDSLSGKISGTPTVSGVFNIALTAGNGSTMGNATLILTVQSRVIASLLVAAGDAKNILEWQPINGFSYNIKRATTSGGPYTTISTVNSPNFTDNNISNGSTYFYVVTSVDSTGESANSLEVVAKPNIGQQEFYQFDETAGSKGIDSWGANHAVLAATALRSAGKYGQSLLLDGSANAYATLPAGIFSTLNDFTISAWVRMDAISTWMRVFDFGSSTTQYMFLTVQAGVTSGKSIIRYATKNGSAAEQNINYSYTFPLNTWTYLAVTRAGNTTTLYINGTSVASSTNITIKPSALGSTTQNYLGKSQFADPMFKGSIDNFKIYSRALNASEITSDMLGDQTITFAAIAPKLTTDANFIPGATVTSNLPLSFTSSDTTVAIITNGNIHIKSPGTTIINASQSGNASYKAATSLNQTLSVQKAQQTITFAAIPDKTLSDTDFPAGAVSNSGLTVSYTSSDTSIVKIISNNLHITGVGTAIITASQSGNAVYTAATPVTQNIKVSKVDQSISFSALSMARPGDPDLILNSSASSGLPVSYRSSNSDVAIIIDNKIHIVGSGNSMITALQAGNARYSATSQDRLFTVKPYNIQVQSRDGDNGQLTNNSIKPYLRLSNADSVAVKYSELTVRYWFTAENYAGINTYIDYAQIGAGNITARYVQLPNPRNNAFGYIEYIFSATTGNLSPGSNSGAIQSRFGNSDWSNLTESNDYSYHSGSAVYSENPNITLYRNGVLIWGTEPAAVDENRKVTVYSENKTSSGNTISVYLSMDNQGNVPLNYRDLSIRYFFTNVGNKPLNYWIDYAKLGTSKINGQINPLLPADTSADTYFRLSVDSSAGKLYPLSNTGNIQYRLVKADWSTFNQTNDYSYQSGASRENPHICVYYQDQLIYGTEPTGTTLGTMALRNSLPRVTVDQNNSSQEVSIAKAVSPNGDGINDFLLIEGITHYPNNRLTVVNRTGALMADIKGYNNADRVFNGRNTGGQPIAAGTYLYSLEYIDSSGKTIIKTGYFLLKYND